MLAKQLAKFALPFVIALAAANVNALAPSSTSYKAGVIENIDLEKKLITIALEKSGETATYRFASNPKAKVNGKKTQDLSVLSPGQSVVLKLRKQAPTAIN